MWWLIVVVVVIAAFAVPRFAKVVLIGVAVLVVIVAAFLFTTSMEENRARTRITKVEVELTDLTLRPWSSETYVLSGRVRNHSARYTLTSLEMKFTMRDCADSSNCDVVGQDDKSIYVGVPPGQTRAISDEYVFFSHLGSPRGRFQWDYVVTSISGK